ncbi:MAG: PBSX family phage terminase large subunit [Candidatus Pacebacteria bacterium]|nr:PBSX family phage terminase large subunit [Candidatus Paceibacterota bacterium]
MELKKKIKATIVFEKTLASQKRITVNEGGTRSSKTYSIAQVLAIKAIAETEPCVYTICRKYFPQLKATAMRDFFTILKEWEWYSEKKHNKSDHIYKLNNTEIEFISLDEPQKIRGRKRKVLWINEANEIEYEDYRQLLLRTTGQIYMDYNPSDEFHWIYDHVLTREDCELIHSTYKDNVFLDETTVQEIERLQTTDENYWKIYGLGLRGTSENKIYTHWQYCDDVPREEGVEKIFGLDFGFNRETCLAEVRIKDDDIYARERLYKKFMTNSDLIKWLTKKKMFNVIIYADSAEPQRIKELQNAGFMVEAADKDVLMGIDALKRRKFYITKDSANGAKEARSYSWKVGKDGKRIDEPIKHNDHFLDAVRYAVYTYFNSGVPGADFL